MSAKNELYLAVLAESDSGYLAIASVTKKTWDAEKLGDEPDEIEDLVASITLPNYTLESSGMDFSILDTISKDSSDFILDLNGALQLKNDLIAEGYTLNEEFAKDLENSSDGYYKVV